jgi:ATP-dependent Clp protease ATP-binding subunit ClpC
MWKRLTGRARRAVLHCGEEAQALRLPLVDVECQLLGLLDDPESVACRVLAHLGCNPEATRAALLAQLEPGQNPAPEEMELTPRAKRTFDLAYEAAREWDDSYVGTEHLLLGILKEGGARAARVLADAGIDVHRVAERVREMREEAPPPSP